MPLKKSFTGKNILKARKVKLSKKIGIYNYDCENHLVKTGFKRMVITIRKILLKAKGLRARK